MRTFLELFQWQGTTEQFIQVQYFAPNPTSYKFILVLLTTECKLISQPTVISLLFVKSFYTVCCQASLVLCLSKVRYSFGGLNVGFDHLITSGVGISMYSIYLYALSCQSFFILFSRWALPDPMAQAGFYHQPNMSGDDRALCFTCNVCLVCWEPTDEPWQESCKSTWWFSVMQPRILSGDMLIGSLFLFC